MSRPAQQLHLSAEARFPTTDGRTLVLGPGTISCRVEIGEILSGRSDPSCWVQQDFVDAALIVTGPDGEELTLQRPVGAFELFHLMRSGRWISDASLARGRCVAEGLGAQFDERAQYLHPTMFEGRQAMVFITTKYFQGHFDLFALDHPELFAHAVRIKPSPSNARIVLPYDPQDGSVSYHEFVEDVDIAYETRALPWLVLFPDSQLPMAGTAEQVGLPCDLRFSATGRRGSEACGNVRYE